MVQDFSHQQYNDRVFYLLQDASKIFSSFVVETKCDGKYIYLICLASVDSTCFDSQIWVNGVVSPTSLFFHGCKF